MLKIMVMSLGGSPEPLRKSIEMYKPEQIIFFASHDSVQLAGNVMSAIDPKPKSLFEITENPNLLFECYKAARACVERVRKSGVQPSEVMIDYTGGTKVMTAALILATVGNQFLFNYVGGDQRNKDGLGAVVDGKEKMFREMSPWSVYAEEERRQVITLFNRRRYAAVMSIVDSCLENRQCPAEITEYFCFVRTVSEGFLLWEQFSHSASLRKIEAGIQDLDTYITKYSTIYLKTFAEKLEKLRQFLGELVRKTSGDPKKFDMILVQDLVSNARRRMLDKRYDDAAARIYRALELYGQVCFSESTGYNNNEVKPDIIPESIKIEYVRKYQNQKGLLKLPLYATFQFLQKTENDAGIRFFEQATQKKMKDIQSNRNMSILAHGVKPVSEHEICSMFGTICDFLQIRTFIEFPELQ